MSDVGRRLGGTGAAPPRSGGVSVDARWLELYAERVDEAAEELAHARAELRNGPLRPQSFGEIGRTLRSAEAYGRAATLLQQQLDRACEVLAAAGKGLHDVAGHYGGVEDEAVQHIKKADRW
jgi:acyl-CoA reductase-like NAD-dependent aldehyde dehydrogenase